MTQPMLKILSVRSRLLAATPTLCCAGAQALGNDYGWGSRDGARDIWPRRQAAPRIHRGRPGPGQYRYRAQRGTP